MSKAIKRFGRGGDAGGGSGGEGSGNFSWNDADPDTNPAGNYDYDYDYGANQGIDDLYYQDGSGSDEGSDGLGWRDNGDGTSSYTEADGTVRNFGADDREIFADQEADNFDEIGRESGWADNGDGSWSYTDADGGVRNFGSDGVEVGVEAEEDPFEAARKESEADLNDSPSVNEEKEINGITYTRNIDGKWQDDEGAVYTDDEIESEAENPTNPADFGAEHVRNPDGSTTTTRTDGLIITKNTDGTTTTQNPGGSTHTTTPGGKTTQTPPASPPAPDKKPIPNNLLAAGGVGLAGLAAMLADKNKGDGPNNTYQGSIDMGMEFNREKIAQDPNRRPGSGGSFLGRGTYGPKGIAALPAAPAPAPAPAPAAPGIEGIPLVPETATPGVGGYDGSGIGAHLPAMGGPQPTVSDMQYRGDETERTMRDMGIRSEDIGEYAAGGIAQAYAKGGPTKPRYLRGETDGMADQIKARIDGGQEARLAHGEFVIPADVVSHLGNGNSDAGAKKLYSMMDKIRVARTGNAKQGKQINADKFLPGMKKMATGGITDAIPRFATGGTTTGVNTWAGPYATNLMGQTNALGNDMTANPGNYVYQGPRAAATNALQTKATDAAGGMNIVNPLAAGAGNMIKDAATKLGNVPTYAAANVGSGYATGPAYDPSKFSSSEFGQADAEKYMNPYLKQSLDPQLAEARRAADITRMTNAGRLVGSGAFGGGRQAVMEAEGDRNLGTNLANITGQGYNTAFSQAQQQFNADQQRRAQADQATEQSKQYGNTSGMTDRSNAANYGLQAAGINERSRESGARMGLDALTASANTAGQYGNFLNSADQNSRANLNTLTGIGNDQYTRDQAGLTADMNQFNEEAALPGQALRLKKDMLNGMPISSGTTTTADPSMLQQLSGLGLTAAQIASLFGDKP